MGGLVADTWGWRWVFVPLVGGAGRIRGGAASSRPTPAPGCRRRRRCGRAEVGTALLWQGWRLIPNRTFRGGPWRGWGPPRVAALGWFSCIAHGWSTPSFTFGSSSSHGSRAARWPFRPDVLLGRNIAAISRSTWSAGVRRLRWRAWVVRGFRPQWAARLWDVGSPAAPRRVLRTGLVVLLIAQVALTIGVAQER